MKNFKFFKSGFKNKLLLVIVILFCNNLDAQVAPIALKWDKTGCQYNLVDQINFDSNFSMATCLKVCQNSMMNYRLIGLDMTNLANIEWTITGGEIETNQEFAIISWDDTNTGTINIKLIFVDGTFIQRTICIEKVESQLVLNWDRIGCQAEENNVSEIKFSNMSLSNPCLKICKDTRPTFSLNGDDLTNIQTIQWLVTGGVAETPSDIKTSIVWDATSTGFITVRIKYFTGLIAQKSVCVNKVNSSLLLEWEKIDENAIHEVKLDNTDANKESLLVYDNRTLDYTIKGNNKNAIASLYWEVIGGFTGNDSGFTVPVTWTDEDIKELIVHINYVDGTRADEKFAIISKAAPINPLEEPNTLKFSYDDSGNQITREFIYIVSGIWRQSYNQSNEPIAEEKLLESDIYSDISYYPNPVQSELFLKWKNSDSNYVERIELYSISGQLLKSINDIKNIQEITFDFQPFPSGYYNLVLVYNIGDVKDLKIIKR